MNYCIYIIIKIVLAVTCVVGFVSTSADISYAVTSETESMMPKEVK